MRKLSNLLKNQQNNLFYISIMKNPENIQAGNTVDNYAQGINKRIRQLTEPPIVAGEVISYGVGRGGNALVRSVRSLFHGSLGR